MVPPWITRWGITMVFVILIGLALVLTIIKYPISRQAYAFITYESQPLALTVPESAILTAVHVNDTGDIGKGNSLMTFESPGGRKYAVEAPVSGHFFLAGPLRPDDFLPAGQVLGYLIPDSDVRIIKLTMDAVDITHLRKGQKVVVRVDKPAGINRDIPGYIDFIGPAFRNQDRFPVHIRLGTPESTQLFSSLSLTSIDSLHCEIDLTVDTTTYLNYIFHRLR